MVLSRLSIETRNIYWGLLYARYEVQEALGIKYWTEKTKIPALIMTPLLLDTLPYLFSLIKPIFMYEMPLDWQQLIGFLSILFICAFILPPIH